MPDRDLRDYLNRRFTSLDSERQSFMAHWRDLADHVRPRRGRFFVTDRNKGTKKYNNIINSKGTQSLRAATAGMLAGTMSPTRPWFSLETQDPGLMERQEVKEWLYRVELLLRSILNESNFYDMASTFLNELLLFGTSAISHVEDFKDVARFYTHTAGSYFISQNERYEVDGFFREFQWTAEQIIRAFGKENVSTHVREAVEKMDRAGHDKWFTVRQAIEPNDDFRPGSPLASQKPFRSIYYEPGDDSAQGKDRFLRVNGFDEFPVYVARWDLTGEDIYSTDCPGMTALGDIKQLQIEEKRKAQAIDKMVNPPLKGNASVRDTIINALPGGLSIYDGQFGDSGLTTLYQVNPQLQDLRADMEAVERRIDTAFFVDLFLAISNIEGIQPRNELDLLSRNEERLLQLGPVLERLQGEFQDKLLDRLFNQAVRAQILPDPPPAIQGSSLKIKYISTLAMAQRAVATQSIDRLVNHVGALMSLGFEDASLKFNAAQSVDEYARAIGSPPSLVVPDDIVNQQKQQRAQQQQLEQALLQAQGAANIAKSASDAKLDDSNVLSEAVG